MSTPNFVHPVREYLTMDGDPDDVIDAEIEDSEAEVDHFSSWQESQAEEAADDDEPRWAEVHWPNALDGYTINTWGVVKSPKGKLLTPQTQGNVKWVSIRGKDGRTVSVRVDKLVLGTFGEYRENMVPEHKNNDTMDCRLENLVWRHMTPTETALAEMGRRKTEAALQRRARGEGPPPRNRSKKKKAPAPSRAVAKPKADPDEIQVYRIYVLGDIKVTVTLQGGIESISPAIRDLTPHQTMQLARVMGKIAEMNKVLGVK